MTEYPVKSITCAPWGAAPSPTDYRPIQQMQFEAFDGESWVPAGSIVSD